MDFAPPGVVAEVLQNVRTILTTTVFSVPLDRELGIDARLVDLPLPRAQARLTTEIIRAIRRFEPRAQVRKVSYTGDGMEGQLVPKVVVSIVESA